MKFAEVEEVAAGGDLCTVQEAEKLSKKSQKLPALWELALPGLQWPQRAPRAC